MKNARTASIVVGASLALTACSTTIQRTYVNGNSRCVFRPPIAAALWGVSSNAGTIEGHVRQIAFLTDSSDTPLDNTEIAVSGPVVRTAIADSAGNFQLAHLPAGHYAVRVRRDGFPTRQDLLVVDAEGAVGDIRLRRGARDASCSRAPQMAADAPSHH